MSIHEGHRNRLRARFLQQGLAAFDEHTALELLLFYARPRCDTNAIAHVLIKRFGSFAAVMDAPLEELAEVEGIGEKSALLLKMVPDLASYYLASRAAPGEVLNSTGKAGEYCLPLFIGKQNEELYLIALDDKRKVLRCVRLAEEGIVNAVRVSVRRVVEETIKTSATNVILAHNHPGGVALPSPEDRQFTAQIFKALQMINVQLVDHIVVVDDDFVSMADSGDMQKIYHGESI